MGDDIQNMKAGLMEIADIFVLNKSDREGVDRVESQLEAMLELAPERDGWKPKIVRTVATENKGVEDLAATIAAYHKHFDGTTQRQARNVEHWKRRLIRLAEEIVLEQVTSGPDAQASLDALAVEVAERKKDPYAAVNELLSAAGLSKESVRNNG
jgi:LAO/AO transport system kinase